MTASAKSVEVFLSSFYCRVQVTKTNNVAYWMVFVGLMCLGVGHSMPWSLGLPLMDDNIKRKSLPTYFAMMFCIKIMGPISGFMIGSLCNRLYYTLTSTMIWKCYAEV